MMNSGHKGSKKFVHKGPFFHPTSTRVFWGPPPALGLKNAELLRSGHCVRPRHMGFGLSLARVATPTPAACSPPVAYGVRPVPAPCDRARPCALGTALRCATTASQEPSTLAFPRHLHHFGFSSMADIFPRSSMRVANASGIPRVPEPFWVTPSG